MTRTKAHTRSFRVLSTKKTGWGGRHKCVLIYRYRGSWALYDGEGGVWCHEHGFKSALAATRAASRHMGRWFQLTRTIDCAACSPRPPR